MHTGSDEEGEVEDGQPIRCGRAIATDDAWCSWLREDLQSCPAWQTHAAILDECATIATGWRARFWADRPLWNRIRRGRRLAKELAESAPVLQQARAAVAALPEGGQPLVILDLCSGFGYLGMFLSELLRPHAARVAKIVLVDIRWPPLTHAKGQDRPTIELYLRTRDQALHAGLRLRPHAVAPERIEGQDFFSAVRAPIDLDAAGRSREDW